MDYVDFNIRNEKLAKKARDEGFSSVRSIEVLEVESEKELAKMIASAKGEFVLETSDEKMMQNALRGRRAKYFSPVKLKDFGRNDAVIAVAKDNGKEFELPLKPLLDSSFVGRARLCRNYSLFLRNCFKAGVKVRFSSRAESEEDLRTPREMIAILFLLGLSFEQAQYCLLE